MNSDQDDCFDFADFKNKLMETMVSTAPAVTNTIYNACGARINKLPATPDKVRAALKAK